MYDDRLVKLQRIQLLLVLTLAPIAYHPPGAGPHPAMIGWLLELFGLPANWSVGFVTSAAIVAALNAARTN